MLFIEPTPNRGVVLAHRPGGELVVEDPESVVEIDAPSPRPPALAKGHHHPVAAGVDELLRLAIKALERFHPVRHRLRRVARAAKGPSKMVAALKPHLEVRVSELRRGGEATARVLVKHPAHQIHVRRRHSP